MRDCERKEPLCTCIDWETGDLDKRIHHLVCNFEFTGFELEYTTLEIEEDRHLCKVGQCRICGKCLCIGRALPSQSAPDELLTEIYCWMFQMWNLGRDRLSGSANCFTDMFLSLFHEGDREFVSEWLCSKARNMSFFCDEEDT